MGVKVTVGVSVGGSVSVGVDDSVGVGVRLAVGVTLAVWVRVGVKVDVSVGEGVKVTVGLGVGLAKNAIAGDLKNNQAATITTTQTRFTIQMPRMSFFQRGADGEGGIDYAISAAIPRSQSSAMLHAQREAFLGCPP
jgi:hypothetical protein